MSNICLVLTEKTIEENRNKLKSQLEYVDLAELRADFLSSVELSEIKKFPQEFSIPIIFTLRKPADGGYFKGSDEERRNLLKAASGNYHYIDIEIDNNDTEAYDIVKSSSTRIIRSFHDFDGIPDDFEEKLDSVPEGEIPKGAVFPNSF